MNTVVLRTFAPTLQSMASIGAAFGSLFLEPLVTGGHGVVVASYGPPNSGKSLLGSSAVDRLPLFYALQSYNIRRPSIDGAYVDMVSKEGAFRYRDFGNETVKSIERGAWKDWFDFIPRHEVAAKDSRYKRGLDLLEHPPSPHLGSADVVFIIGQKFPKESQIFSKRYFDDMANTIAGRDVRDISQFNAYDASFYGSTNPRMPQILDEMRKMKAWIKDPQGDPQHHERAVIAILTSSRPSLRDAFNNFAQSVALR